MTPSLRAMGVAASAAGLALRSTANLTDLCTVSVLQSILPANETLLGIDIISDTLTASVVTQSSGGAAGAGGGTVSSTSSNSTSSSGPPSKRATTSDSSSTEYCNVTFAYTHPGSGDVVNVIYAFPSPDDFENRFYLGGGGGYSLNTDATGGLDYGAVSGATDAGYDAFSYSYDEKALYGNGSINWHAAHMFGYQALGELTKIGKYLTPQFYGLDDDTKIYTYFSGCSDGGREAMSQVQRWGKLYDGVVAGAPAFRFAQQQVQHVVPAAMEVIANYFPPPCALEKIVTETISACDGLDGRSDGVISRSDLCKLNFDLTSIIGTSYYCEGSTSSSMGYGTSGGTTTRKRAQTTGSQSSTTPTQNGTVTAQDVAIAQSIYDGLMNSKGQQAYLSWQIGAELSDAEPTYDNSTETWGVNIPSTGGMYVRKFVELLDLDNLETSDLDNITSNDVVHWMNIGFKRFYDSLQTTFPDLSAFQEKGGKLIHYHGESDPSIPSPSSVHYWQSVRSSMYPDLSDADAETALNDWYQFYLIPGAAHCGANSLQPGPYPSASSLMDQIIDWVENGDTPTGLNSTVSSGDYEGETQWLCQWPNRPLWTSNSTFDCVFDQDSYDSWTYTFPAFHEIVY